MSGFADVLNELFPTDWLDPYGSMPLNKQYSVQIDITQVETDDGIKVTAVKTPPSASTTSVQDAINMALGMGCCEDIAERGDSQDSKGNIAEREDSKPSKKPKDEPEDDDSGESDDKPDWNKKKDD